MSDIVSSLIVIAVTGVVILFIFFLVNRSKRRQQEQISQLARERGWKHEPFRERLSWGLRLSTAEWVYETLSQSVGIESDSGSSNIHLSTNWRSITPSTVTGVVMLGPNKDMSVAGPFAEMLINKMLTTFLGADAGKYANLSEYKGVNPPPQKFMIWTNSPGDAERVLTLELVRALDKWSGRYDPVIKLTPEGISIAFAGVKLEKAEDILAVVGLGNLLLRNAGQALG